MKKIISILAAVLLIFAVCKVKSQSVGFSYFFPTDGYFSNPIAPVNLSLPVSFGKYFQISPGISMNSIGGMSLTGLDDGLNADRPLVGPFQSINGSLLPTIVIPTKSVKLYLMGGVFGFATLNTKIIHGNFDKMLREQYDYNAVNSNMQFDKDNFGWGYVYGLKFSFKVQKNIWAYLGANYYMGSQDMSLHGDITAATASEGIVHYETGYPDTALKYEGLEIIIGVSVK
ncbi:MAG: hypothetical protein R6V32_02255 [Bacteroidales bacterium]